MAHGGSYTEKAAADDQLCIHALMISNYPGVRMYATRIKLCSGSEILTYDALRERATH